MHCETILKSIYHIYIYTYISSIYSGLEFRENFVEHIHICMYTLKKKFIDRFELNESEPVAAHLIRGCTPP